ncbi:DUF2156 domain-containing protein [Desulfovibrio sp. JC022]|uniref:DUF2156 domain-containing protein n=1 Tax=Desulfovibrio sp. JC022 TaxID=2593642 RepID=UPI0013D5FD2F|nr:DUF2156 domain-containing protein [Desulfovibrio sp. JC022]NDV22792.1 DUF2156 domain-containing protein [Desulfovibrio sp. JC022]
MNLNRAAKLRFLHSDDPGCLHTLLPYLKMYGNRCLSYSTTQPGLNHALLESSGYISWIETSTLLPGKNAVILSEPVCAPEQQLPLIKRMEKHLGKITLVQIGEKLAEILFEEGFSVYQIGVETELDIQTFSLTGKHKCSLRQWRNKCLKSGLTVEEKKLSEIDRQEIDKLCYNWLKGKGGKELSFLTRPMADTDEEGVRFFWTRKDGDLQALAGFDPLCSSGSTVGYYHNFDRICSGAVNGASAFTLLNAMDKFRLENKQILSLGLSPLSGMEQGYDLVGPLQKLAQFFYEYGEKIYPFKGNARHKSKFCGTKKKVYVASNAGWFRTMIAASTACGLEL